MAHPVFARIGGSPLGRAGLAIISILALAGFAAGGLPLTCRVAPGAVFCPGATDANALVSDVAEPADTLAEAVPPLTPAAQAEQKAPGAAGITQTALVEQPPSLTNNDLVAATFEALQVGLVSTGSDLTTRKVKTITINPDGTPVTDVAQAAPAPAANVEPETLVADAAEEPVVEASAEVVAEAPAPIVEEEDAGATSLAYAPARGDSASVTGKGANVRSLPQKGGSDVLFALTGGAEITIVEMRRGWAKIVDAQGRSGWIYAQYLNRS